MGRHRRSQINYKELFVFLIFTAIGLFGTLAAWNVLQNKDIQDVTIVEPEIKSKAIDIPEIIVPSSSEVQYIKPQVLTVPAPVKIPVIEEPRQIPQVSPVNPLPTNLPIEPQPQLPVSNTDMAWANSVMNKYNYWANPITKWHFVSALPVQCAGNACVTTVTKSDTGEVVSIDLYMHIGERSEYLLIHEVVHTNGIMDECAADAKTAEIRGTTEGLGYYQCGS